MDPTTTYAVMQDDDEPVSVRRQAALDLLVWLAKGGFGPTGVSDHDAIEAAELVLAGALDELLGVRA